jgi:hypothetical protein
MVLPIEVVALNGIPGLFIAILADIEVALI